MSATPPWYRHRWPWLLAIAPTAALVSGVFTFWLAATTNNSMVVDDYYREGRAINQQLARDRQASVLGLQATLSAAGGGSQSDAQAGTDGTGAAGPTITLELTALHGSGWPDQLRLRVIHATNAELDVDYLLRRVGEGLYRTAGVLPVGGRWLVQIEDPGRTWRLVEPVVTRFDAPIRLQAATP